MLVWDGLTGASAQDSSSRSILKLGDAVVTGFSGVQPPTGSPPPRVDPIEKTFIDLDRQSARVINLDVLRGPALGQLVQAPKPFSVTAVQVGQVFSIALDDATPPNIYLAATSAYGLPIVVPDRDGDGRPDRSRRGGPNASFMPGLFGPVTVDGGPGSIWRIDGTTGAVRLFANVVLDRIANSGPALGGLAFDTATRQLFVADRDTGMIHRFGLDGADRGRFDHGVSGRSAVGLTAVPFDPRKRLNIEQPAFDSGNPATWAYAPPERRIFGLAVRDSRLFYAVAAGLQVWSVAITPAGGFGTDPRLELNVPRGQSVAEISNIVFDADGRMILAERGAPTGAYDFKALAESGENRVLRFRLKRPGDPPSLGLWYPVGEEYAIGFPPDFRNDNGGLAIGYGYDTSGNINRAACGGTLWSTGEQLRNARARAIIQWLQPGGPLIVDGLQGNAIRLVRPQNEPPFESYYIDYDDRFDDAAARGHLGDVEIWRVCAQAAVPPLVPALACPTGWSNVGGVCLSGLACPRGTEFADGCCVYRDCPPSYVSIRGKCVPPPLNCKPDETYVDGRCEPAKCPPGLVVVDEGGKGKVGDPPKTADPRATGKSPVTVICPGGQPMVNDQCAPSREGGKKICGGYCGCPTGTKPGKDGTCVTTPPPTTPPPGSCKAGSNCCPDKSINLGGNCCPLTDYYAGKCGTTPPTTGVCPVDSTCCPDNSISLGGKCCQLADYDSKSGTCGTTPPKDCTWLDQFLGKCRPAPGDPSLVIDCTGGKIFRDNVCVCPSGYEEDVPGGTCVKRSPIPDLSCTAGQEKICTGTSCICAPTGGCTTLGQLRGECVPPPPVDGFCQGGPFRLVGGTCCLGDNYSCTQKATNGTCPSGTEFDLGPPYSSSPACCRSHSPVTAGICGPPPPRRVTIPPPTDIEVTTPPRQCGNWVWVPIIGSIVCDLWTPGAEVCQSDTDCPARTTCTPEGRCIDQGTLPVTGFSVPPPCTPEAAAAGACVPPPPPPGGCKSGLFPSNDGKTCCTREQITSETCGTKPPERAVSVPKKKKQVTKKKQEEDVQPRDSSGFSIGIGGGRSGGGRSGGGRSGGGGGGGGGGGSRPR